MKGSRVTGLKVCITIDTEHSIGGAFEHPGLRPVGNERRVYGRVEGREYGIGLIMDIADRYGIPLTFFVEVLNKHYFGEGETREVCQYILGRGHDVQLHLHPNYLTFKTAEPGRKYRPDNMSAYDLAEQCVLVGEGLELLTRYCGRPPVAFRAGNYGADGNTLKALKAHGMLIDSSYNAAFPQPSRRLCAAPLNDAAQLGGIWELPITNFVEALPLRERRLKPLDVNGVSFAEMRTVLEKALAGEGPAHMTFILHSFSFLRALDVQYRRCRVRHYVVERFEALCRYLAGLPGRIACLTLAGLAEKGWPPPAGTGAHHYPSMPARLSVLRVFEQQYGEMGAR